MDDKDLTFIGHLEELRKRIIAVLVLLCVTTLVSFPMAPGLLKIFKMPASGAIQKLAYFSPEEAFMVYMRLALLCGIVLALPFVIYQLWAFVAPAIGDRPKRYAGRFVLFSFSSFLAGCLFAYFILLPKGLVFLLSFGSEDMMPVISAEKYISFVTGLTLACGFVFQMPVLSYLLTKIGVIDPQFLRKHFKYALVGIAIFSAAITPTTDIFNMMALMIPMLFLYEISIWVSALARKGCLD